MQYNKEDVSKFLNEKFNISIDGYSDTELNELLIKIRDILEDRLKEEEKELNDLEKKLQSEEMLLENNN